MGEEKVKSYGCKRVTEKVESFWPGRGKNRKLIRQKRMATSVVETLSASQHPLV